MNDQVTNGMMCRHGRDMQQPRLAMSRDCFSFRNQISAEVPTAIALAASFAFMTEFFTVAEGHFAEIAAEIAVIPIFA